MFMKNLSKTYKKLNIMINDLNLPKESLWLSIVVTESQVII